MRISRYANPTNLINLVIALILVLAIVSAFITGNLFFASFSGIALAFHIIGAWLCLKRASLLGKMEDKLLDASDKGLATAIELVFDVPKSGEMASISRNLNYIFNETKRVFWDIRENLFETKIHYSILENLKLVMVSYIQKVVNIGNVRGKLNMICSRIGDTTGSVRAIMGSIISLANKSDEEAVTITQASEALKKLFSIIGRITRVTSESREMANELEATTRMGGNRVETTLKIIKQLDSGTDEMLSIISIIDDIAESTNLLSINAGIEAAHTGEAGKGFRVIADEIMKLVVSTKKNAANISSLLKQQVRNTGEALKEASASGSVFSNVSSEVEGAVRTWAEISEQIEEMSRETRLIHEATERLTGITSAVAESSLVIRASIEKIEKEISDLNRASDETCDILEKITAENNEEQKSTMEVLQQLNKVTKFVVNLNKAIDFFNIGKRIFFLFPDEGKCKLVMSRVIEEEYELFEIDNYKILPKLLREYTNSILFINYSCMPENLTIDEIFQAIGKKTSLKNLLAFCILCGNEHMEVRKQEGFSLEKVVFKKDNEAENARIILSLLEKHKAKGLRKYIRVECSDKDAVKIKFPQEGVDLELKVINLSSSAILCEARDVKKAATGKKPGELALVFAGEEYRLSCIQVFHKEENRLLLGINLKGYPDTRRKIYSFIFEKLQEKLKEELATIHD